MFDVKVVQQRRTSARTRCVRTEECVSASGTPTAATAPPATEERTVNKVRRFVNNCLYLHMHSYAGVSPASRTCVYMLLCELRSRHKRVFTYSKCTVCVSLDDFQEIVCVLEIKWDQEQLPWLTVTHAAATMELHGEASAHYCKDSLRFELEDNCDSLIKSQTKEKAKHILTPCLCVSIATLCYTHAPLQYIQDLNLNIFFYKSITASQHCCYLHSISRLVFFQSKERTLISS